MKRTMREPSLRRSCKEVVGAPSFTPSHVVATPALGDAFELAKPVAVLVFDEGPAYNQTAITFCDQLSCSDVLT